MLDLMGGEKDRDHEGDEQTDDATGQPAATSGHSEADSQAQRNTEDESPS